MEVNSKEFDHSINTSIEEIKTHLNKIVKSDNLNTLTPKKVREELEKALGLPYDSLKSRKSEINDLIDTIILEIKENNEKAHTNNEEKYHNLDANSSNLNKQNDRAKKRKQISMTIEEFLEKSQVLSLTINGSNEKLTISPRQFSTGSVGWYYGGKVPLPVGDDLEVVCQVSINCTVVGSKSWSQNTSKKSRNN